MKSFKTFILSLLLLFVGVVGFSMTMNWLDAGFSFLGVPFINILPYASVLFGAFILFVNFDRGYTGFGASNTPRNQYVARTGFLKVVRFVFGPVAIFMGIVTLVSSLSEMFPYLSLNSIPGSLILGAIGAIGMTVSSGRY
jgi:hypothetical protein